jgi:hypothetical protein
MATFSPFCSLSRARIDLQVESTTATGLRPHPFPERVVNIGEMLGGWPPAIAEGNACIG